MNKVLLLDAYNLIYRARYSGMNKGDHSTIFNFFRGLRPLIEKFDPDIAYFVLEGKPVKRLNMNADYKGQRVYHNNDGFNEQRKEILKIVEEHFPMFIVKHNDYECDDVINHLAVKVHHQDDVTIISSDTDFIQSVSDRVKLYNPVRKKYIDGTDYDYVEWKSLVGDNSDNIKGFKGIGDKRAKSLLETREKLEEFLIKENNREIFERNNFMIRFHDMSEDQSDMLITFPRIDSQNWSTLKEKFKSMDFNSMTAKDKTWTKYVNTFNKLERNLENARSSLKQHHIAGA